MEEYLLDFSYYLSRSNHLFTFKGTLDSIKSSITLTLVFGTKPTIFLFRTRSKFLMTVKLKTSLKCEPLCLNTQISSWNDIMWWERSRTSKISAHNKYLVTLFNPARFSLYLILLNIRLTGWLFLNLILIRFNPFILSIHQIVDRMYIV